MKHWKMLVLVTLVLGSIVSADFITVVVNPDGSQTIITTATRPVPEIFSTNSVPEPNYVAAVSQISSNGLYFVDEEGHVWSITAASGVIVSTQVSFSPFDPVQAKARITSNAVVEVARVNALKALKKSVAYTGLTNKLAALDADYSIMTGQVASINWSNANWTNKLQNILERNIQCVDDNRDALNKSIKLIKDLAGNQ